MAALNDSTVLATDATFQGRVKAALVETCLNIQSEAITVSTQQIHKSRMILASNILNNINGGGSINWPQTFTITVATDPTTIAAALAGNGGVAALSTGNVQAQAASVPDADIVNAVASQFNAFLILT